MHSWNQRICGQENKNNPSQIIEDILAARGIVGKDNIESFLNPSLAGLHPPHLLPNIEEASERLVKAIEESKNILIFGDYDADGVISLCLMYNFLLDLGIFPKTHIPNRFEDGYDISLKFIQKAKKYGLIVCVDCGTNSMAVKEFVNSSQGYPDIIVCDHHEPLEGLDHGPSPKFKVINPKLDNSRYPFKYLSGAGVTFKLIVHTLRKIGKERKKGFSSNYLTNMLDMVAISTISDVMPLIDENRIMVKKGLKLLRKSHNKGLRCLLETNQKTRESINTYDVAYVLAPRLNSSGRVKTAKLSSDILKSDTSDIQEKVDRLNSFNRQRRNIQEEILGDILNRKGLKEQIRSQKIFIEKSIKWNEGVMGIVASNMVKKFNVPVILFTEKEGVLKGSGRSIQSFDLYSNLCSLNKYFNKFGGHRLACGITMAKDRYQDFKNELLSIARLQSGDSLKKTIAYDMALDFRWITSPLLKELEKLEPFGEANPRPVFRTDRCQIDSASYLTGGRHVKLSLKKDKIKKEAIFFNIEDSKKAIIDKKDKINILYNLGKNNWNGISRIQLLIVDLF